jgi:hypothetical protein
LIESKERERDGASTLPVGTFRIKKGAAPPFFLKRGAMAPFLRKVKRGAERGEVYKKGGDDTSEIPKILQI